MRTTLPSHRDRAWVWCLFNSRRRPGEVFKLTLGDIEVHPEGYIDLAIRPEKGSAAMPASLYEDAVPALLTWLDSHPRKGDPGAPLWVGLKGLQRGKPVTYRFMHKVSIEAARRASIKKPADPYNFRRSGLTLLSKDPAIPYSIFERIGGWVPGSRAPRRYIHIGNRDVQDVLNTRYGITPASPLEASAPRTPKVCGRCQNANRADARFCLRCGGPLDASAMIELKGKETEDRKLMWAAFSPSSDSKAARAQSEYLEKKLEEVLTGSTRIQALLRNQAIVPRNESKGRARSRPVNGGKPTYTTP